MSKLTPIYKFTYLQPGDIIYPKIDQDNMMTAENQIQGAYSYIGSGITSGWLIHWMGCLDDPYVIQQRQALIDGYRQNPFSYFGLQYQSLNYPSTQSDWVQIVVVEPGLGVIVPFYCSTEYPTFFRFIVSGHFYIYAQTNQCTNTEYICSIIQSSDPNYTLYNNAIYIGELYSTTINEQEFPMPIQGSVVQAELLLVPSGETYTLPPIVETNQTLNIPIGVSVAPSPGGSIVYGSQLVTARGLLPSDAGYNIVPSVSRPFCQVIDMAANGLTGPDWPTIPSSQMFGGNNLCNISVPRLFCDNQPMPFARYPSSPYTGPSAIYAINTATDGVISFQDSLLPPIQSTNVFAQSYITGEYTDYYGPCSINGIGISWTVFSPEINSGIQTSSRYWLFNVLDYLLLPGTSYYDDENNLFYFIPIDNNTHYYRVSMLNDDLLYLPNFSATPMTIGGSDSDQISLRHGNACGINLYETANVTLQNVQAIGFGQDGFNLGGATTSWIVNNVFSQYCGRSGMIINGGVLATLTPSNNIIANIYLDQNCQQCRSTSGQLRVIGCGHTISATITNSVNQAAIFQSPKTSSYVLFVDTAAQEAGDVGAIYGGQDPIGFGNTLLNLIIKNLPGPLNSIKDGYLNRNALYLDDCSGGWTINNPTFVDILGGNGIFLGGGRANTIINPSYININGINPGTDVPYTPFWVDDRGSFYAISTPNESYRWMSTTDPGSQISGISYIGTAVTADLPLGHGFFAGYIIIISGVMGLSNVNGTWTVTSSTNSSIEFSVNTAPSGLRIYGSGTVRIASTGDFYTDWGIANTASGSPYASFGMGFSDMLYNNRGAPMNINYTGTIGLYSGNNFQTNWQYMFTSAPIGMATPSAPFGVAPAIPQTPSLPIQPQGPG